MVRAAVFARTHAEALTKGSHESLRGIEASTLSNLVNLDGRAFRQQSPGMFELLPTNVLVRALANRFTKAVFQPPARHAHMQGQFLYAERLLDVLEDVIDGFADAAIRHGDDSCGFAFDDSRGRDRCELAGGFTLQKIVQNGRGLIAFQAVVTGDAAELWLDVLADDFFVIDP